MPIFWQLKCQALQPSKDGSPHLHVMTKFGRDSDLMRLQTHLNDHFVDCGMDSITYLEDPERRNKIHNIVSHHL
jgi:hypothetical protein